MSSITKLVIQVGCLLLLAVGLGLIAYARRTDSIDRSVTKGSVPAEGVTQSAALKHLSEVGFIGVVMASKSVDLEPKLSGRVETVHVRMGERVDANAPIAMLDTAAIRHELKIGEAKLVMARAEADKAKAQHAQARDQLESLTPLKDAGHISAKELADVQYQEKTASAGYDAARAHIDEAVAQVQQLRQTLNDAQIRAPFAGVISERYVDPGAMVSPSVPIARLVSADDLRVRFAIGEDDAGAVSLGAAVRVEVTNANAVLKGTVENIAPEIDIATRYLLAEARLEPAEAPASGGGAGFKRTFPSGTVVRVYVIAPVHTGAH